MVFYFPKEWSPAVRGDLVTIVSLVESGECHGQLNWIHPRTITVMSNMYKRKVLEALEIKRPKILNETDKMCKILNIDNDD